MFLETAENLVGNFSMFVESGREDEDVRAFKASKSSSAAAANVLCELFLQKNALDRVCSILFSLLVF